jgi:tetratricopeptide (TPR) repeat protein
VGAPAVAYSREDTRRLLGISERRLAGWERQKLVARSASYGFREMLALRTLARLHENKVPPAQIRRALAALVDKLSHVRDPLTDLKLFADGKRIRVELDGRTMKRLLDFPAKDTAAEERGRRASAERWFQRGLDLEQAGAPVEEVIAAYRCAIEQDPKSAGALVNLGTIQFNARDWKEAERCYVLALEADPEYSLAHFDLANLYDERGERAKALEHYQTALRLSPNYADAHYNIALLYQGSNQPMKAVRHWTAYLKLDSASHWAGIARRELAKLREAAVVRG